MKTQHIIFTTLFIIASVFTATAQDKGTTKKETFKVAGECGMCKKTIEKAALSSGATTANWNEKKKTLTVSYNTAQTSNQQIQQAVAAAGYDTRDLKANDAAYDKLDECCKYERKAQASAPARSDSTHH
jgi:periplasmic mercuric ion binding protein